MEESIEDLRLVDQRNAGVDVEHLRAGLDPRQRLGRDARIVAGGHLGGQQLATRRVDALADDDEAALEADGHFARLGCDYRVGHAGSFGAGQRAAAR